MNGKKIRNNHQVSAPRKPARVAILGTGNIGSDLLTKVMRSAYLRCVLFAGQHKDSPGITRAKSMGIPVSHRSIDAIVERAGIDIVFDATSAQAHILHAPLLKKQKIFTIDMTPSKIGELCVPVVNLSRALTHANVSMISCGGQATIPIIHSLSQILGNIPYVEIVSSISSKSAGIGTRDNIDEYTQTTSDALVSLGQVTHAKTIIILNPADPPIMMHNTMYIPFENPPMETIKTAIDTVVTVVRQYVPGYALVHPPYFDHGRIVIQSQVVGLGDFLPVFAGNLDIINCAAIAVAEGYAKKRYG